MIIIRILRAISMMGIVMAIINPIVYRVDNTVIDNLPQRVYTLNLNMDNPYLEISNCLSYDVMFGYEKTSEMAKRHDAPYAVNGMFYDPDGKPYGILVEKGHVISMGSIGTPVFYVTQDHKVGLENLTIKGFVEGDGKSIELFGTNTLAYFYDWVLFDKTYGKTTRVMRKSMNYLIKDNVVVDILNTDQPVNLEEYDYVLTQVTPDTEHVFEKGEEVQLRFEYSNGVQNISQAFQTGGYLVYQGENVAKSEEAFIGSTTAPNPRTLVGITESGNVIFKVIDGRNPGISTGVSGDEAARLMLEEGCIYAAYLDGGASSTMVVNGNVANTPSDGEERPVAHSLLIRLEILQ